MVASKMKTTILIVLLYSYRIVPLCAFQRISMQRGFSITKIKTQPSDENQELPSLQVDDKNQVYFHVSPKKRVTICEWQGDPRVDLREFYERDGKWLPGKKGIALSLTEYQIIKQFIEDGTIDDILTDLEEEKVDHDKREID